MLFPAPRRRVVAVPPRRGKLLFFHLAPQSSSREAAVWPKMQLCLPALQEQGLWVFRHPLPQSSLHTSRTRNMVLLYCALYTMDACGQKKTACVFSPYLYSWALGTLGDLYLNRKRVAAFHTPHTLDT